MHHDFNREMARESARVLVHAQRHPRRDYVRSNQWRRKRSERRARPSKMATPIKKKSQSRKVPHHHHLSNNHHDKRRHQRMIKAMKQKRHDRHPHPKSPSLMMPTGVRMIRLGEFFI